MYLTSGVYDSFSEKKSHQALKEPVYFQPLSWDRFDARRYMYTHHHQSPKWKQTIAFGLNTQTQM